MAIEIAGHFIVKEGCEDNFLQELGTAAKGIGAELLLDLVHSMAELFLFVRRSEKLKLLRIAAVAMEVAGGYADEPDFLIQRKLSKQFTRDHSDFFAGLDELFERTLF